MQGLGCGAIEGPVVSGDPIKGCPGLASLPVLWRSSSSTLERPRGSAAGGRSVSRG